MQKYQIGYCNENHALITSTAQTLAAESIDQACVDFIKQNKSEIYPFILINDEISNKYSLRDNPNHQVQEKIQTLQNKKSSVLETLATPNFEKANPTTDSETLRTIMLIQAKQLYWIRIIGIPFLCSAVITAIYMILLIFK